MIKCAIYIRVSTEEQNIHGLSLETQKQNLIEYAKNANYEIVGIYCDGGISARKKATKREELQRLLSDVQEGLIDIIIFTKLDRWFRNISEYYKVQDILEKHGVNWKTIYENYDTTTASGRLHINIMLSVAQDEADRTSERIKAVFDAKVKRGEVLSGKNCPLGYKVENKRLVEDPETSYIVKEAYRLFLLHQSKAKLVKLLKELYDFTICDKRLYRMLHNDIYIGRYRDNNAFCPPLVSYDDFMEVQNIIKNNKNLRDCSPKHDVHYIFSGMLKCAECQKILSGGVRRYVNKHGVEKQAHTYRCQGHYKSRICSHRGSIGEKKIEKYLLDNIHDEIENYIVERNITVSTPATPAYKKNKVKRSDIIKKLERLKDLYVNEMIDIELYKKDYDMYNELLENLDREESKNTNNTLRNIQPLKDFINSDFEKIYNSLSNEEKRILWRSIIEYLIIDCDKNITIIFK